MIDDITYTTGTVDAPEDLTISDFAPSSGTGQLSVKFTPKRNRSYELHSSPDLSTWTPLETDISPGAPAVREHEILVPRTSLSPELESKAFFRVVETAL